jgi:hypothetical protein
MSRWITNFKQHPFQDTWKRFRDQLLTTKVDDVTILPATEELDRLKKATAHIQEVIEGIDPVFVPSSTWDNFRSQADAALSELVSYQSNRNIGHLTNINLYIDNMLTYVKPYYVIPANMAKPLRSSIKAIGSEMDQLIFNVRAEATEILASLRSSKAEIDSHALEVRSIAEKTHAFEKEVFEGDEEHIPTETAIRDARTTVKALTSEIIAFHNRTVVGDESLKADLQRFEISVHEKQRLFDELQQTTAEKSERLAQFYTKIFGVMTADGKSDETGLEHELNARTAHLLTVESEQDKRYDALFKKIEELLPGANSAGLASAYGVLAKKFDTPIATYTNVFYISLTLLLFIAFLTSVAHIEIYPKAAIEFVKLSDWDVALRAFLFKLPFAGPLIWLAMFSSARRSQYERLKQEYSHKEALARSYESYKKELIDLKTDSEEMLKALISKAIDTISYNASTTLDNKHVEATPASKILENLKKDDIEKFLEKLTDLVSKNKKD